ncbi:MAG: RidA family protein [Rhodospirillaceae bacterium]|nr:RidA family protein [Rhodospirillaceae bacterium]
MLPIERIDTGARISRAVIHNGIVYVSGQASPEPADNAEGQTRLVLAKIDELLARAGSSKERILFAQVHLADMAHFDAMNAAWVAWLAPPAVPARTVVQARLPRPDFLVEITVMAAQ